MITNKKVSRTFIKGFTLIELLVVIAIIGILASIVLASLNTARQKGRDARRMADMDAIKKALVLYYDDNSSAYPIDTTSPTTTIDGTDTMSAALLGANVIPTIPLDPLNPDPTNIYRYKSDATGSQFWLQFCLETSSIPGYAQGCNNVMSM